MSAPWGASPKEWDHFDIVLGLTADLLPVVSNPGAMISEASTMRLKGKTPSIYNRAHEVAGLKDWTDRQTTPRQIETWAKESDYGICIQTREVRALDVDVPDVRDSERLVGAFLSALGLPSLPTRRRDGTGKRLLAFTVDGTGAEFRKRSFRVEGGLVEFLATKQQFVAIGAHFDGKGDPSGTRYEWEGGLPKAFPAISLADFERAWAAIVAEFGIEPERRVRDRTGSGVGEPNGLDPVAAHLEANWTTYGEDGEKLYVLCPFKDGHSTDSGETEAAWLLAGTGEYAQGHFRCLHASCDGRTDAEFKKAVGYKAASADDFEDLGPQEPAKAALADPEAAYMAAAAGLASPAPGPSTKVKKTAAHPEGVPALPLPGFNRDKNGDVEPTLPNVAVALASAQACGVELQYDTFRDDMMLAEPGTEDWRAMTDADAVDLRIWLETRTRFKPVGKEMMRDALVKIAADRRFDSATHWLERIVPAWDGVERIGRFYPDYFNTADTPYTQACGRYVWSAHAGRILEPGVQADMIPVLIGDEGLRKSSGIRAMAPADDFFAKLDLDVRDDDLARKMRGILVAELDELKGLAGRSAEAIKSWITLPFDEWTPKYMERKQRFWRRLVFTGSGNDRGFMGPNTGRRRWLPMDVLDVVDSSRIVADRLQLWAEGRELFKASGVAYADAERLAKNEHHAFRSPDPWDAPVTRWLNDADTAGRTPRMEGVTGEDVFVMCLGIDAGRVQRKDQQRLAEVLKAAGMISTQRKREGRNLRLWIDADEDLA